MGVDYNVPRILKYLTEFFCFRSLEEKKQNISNINKMCTSLYVVFTQLTENSPLWSDMQAKPVV